MSVLFLMGELSYEKIAKGTKLPIEEIERMAGKEIICKKQMALKNKIDVK